MVPRFAIAAGQPELSGDRVTAAVGDERIAASLQDGSARLGFECEGGDTMSSSENRTSARMNRQPLHSPEEVQREEAWKTSPSTEVTSDQGENARLAHARKIDENAPRSRRPKPRR
jgi:hypothetical protein